MKMHLSTIQWQHAQAKHKHSLPTYSTVCILVEYNKFHRVYDIKYIKYLPITENVN